MAYVGRFLKITLILCNRYSVIFHENKKKHVQPIFSFLQEYNESCFVAENSVQGTVFYGFSFPDLVMELYTPFRYEHLSTCNLIF